MKRVRFDISAGAVLIFALAYFFDESGYTAAIVPAAAVHELGHAAAIRLGGARVRALSLGVFGLKMDYSGSLYGLREAAAIACGPLAGLIYGLLLAKSGGAFRRMSGELSLALTFFNLLPVLPLDGGRLAAVILGEKAAVLISRVFSLILCAGAAALLMLYRVPAPLPLAIWLAAYNLKVR